MLDGDDPAELVSLGTVFAQIGELQAALDPLIRAAHLDNEDYESRFNLGLVYLHLKQYREAKPWLSAAVSLQPESFEAIALLGSALFSLGEDLAAVEQLNHAHRLQPNNDKVVKLLLSECQMISRHALAEGNYAQAATYLENASEVQPSSPEIHELAFQVARESFVHSNYESAIRALKVSSQSMQNNADFHAMLGFASYKQGDAGTAMRELQRAMDLDPRNLNYVLQLSEVFVANSNAEASITLLEAAAHVFPESAKVWFALGTSEIAAEHLEGAEEALKRAQTLDPNLDEIYVVLGRAYRNAGRWNDLLAISDKLMHADAANYIGYFYKAFALARGPDGDSKEIEKLLERACALDTDDPEPHYELAKLDASRGDKDRAVLELEKATRANPHFAQAYYQLHRLYAERGDAVRSAEAERTYEQLRKERDQPVRKLLVRVRER